MSALRMGKNNQWTPASLRKHFRARVSELATAQERLQFAYGVLSGVATNNGWGMAQRRAIALGLEQGMKSEPICGAWGGCPLPKGQVDIPENHQGSRRTT